MIIVVPEYMLPSSRVMEQNLQETRPEKCGKVESEDPGCSSNSETDLLDHLKEIT